MEAKGGENTKEKWQSVTLSNSSLRVKEKQNGASDKFCKNGFC